MEIREKLQKDFGFKDLTDRLEEIDAIIAKVVKEKDAAGDKEDEPLKVQCLSNI